MTAYQQRVIRVSDLSQEIASFRIQGMIGSCSASAVTSVDWEFPEERWLTGGSLLIKNATWGSKVDVEIVDKNNVLGYGANVGLNTFAKNFYVTSDQEMQLMLDCPYVALVPAGIFLRIKYDNTSLLIVDVAFNLFTHIPKA